MTVDEAIRHRGISELLHFTTNKGAIGILDTRALRSRARVERDQRLEFILQMNSNTRYDTSWEDYVNFSVSEINTRFFNFSSGWHPALWWCLLSFDPLAMTDRGVVFVTTNNIYPSARRAKGNEGLDALFGDTVKGMYGKSISRPADLDPRFPTCEQAEVLYPGEISTSRLQRIYVREPQHQDELCATLAFVGHPSVPIDVNPAAFETRR